MNHIRYIFLLLVTFICAQAYCQDISVKSFRLLDNDLTANTAGTTVLDQNGEKAALIKVVTTQTGFSFDCGSIGIVKTIQKPSEIWVYVPQGARRITISHPRLGILRDYEFPMPIEKARTYELVLTTGQVQTVVQQDAGGQYLILKLEPKSSVVKIDNVEVSTDDGVLTKFLTYGNHNYSVSNPLYHEENGIINIGQERKELEISLKPNYSALSLSTIPENGAKVTIDNEENPSGETPFTTGKLITGEHKFRFQMPEYETKDTDIFVNGDGSVHDYAVQMQSNFGTVNISAQKGIHIFINNVNKGVSSWSGRLTEGTYIIEAKRKSYRSTYKTIKVIKGKTLDVSLDPPTPIYGILNIDSHPYGAKVYLDNILLGNTPNIFNEILVGTHTVTIKKIGYKDLKEDININEDSICHLDVNMSELPKIKYDKVEYVDLGLNVCWAKFNIGASSKYEYGNFYAWGEIISKDSFTYDNYKYWNNEKGMTKYVSGDILDNADDPVKVEYQGGWYTPSVKDWEELQSKCTWIWDKKGYTVIGPNSNSIYLPSTGYYDAIDGYIGKDVESMYWTNQVDRHSDYESTSYYIDSKDHYISKEMRWYGLPIRPVIAKASIERWDSTIVKNKILPKNSNDETTLSLNEGNNIVNVLIETDGIIRGIFCDGKYINFEIKAIPQLLYSFYTNIGPHILVLESKHKKKTTVIVNVKSNNQIIKVELRK